MASNGLGRTEEVGGRAAGERASAERSRVLLEKILSLHGSGLDEEAIASRILGPEPEVVLFRTQTLVAIVIDLVGRAVADRGRARPARHGDPFAPRGEGSPPGGAGVRWADQAESTNQG